MSGAVNGAVFAAYLDQVLGPTLRSGDVVVLDNLPAHKVAGLAEVVEVRGARLLYLPSYSPDFNPGENARQAVGTTCVNSNPGCARPRPAPARPWKQSFKRLRNR